MIKRESYMRRIRPFIGGELIKVMTGIRRCGKSVMLELVKQELLDSGVGAEQFITLNFEDLRNAPLCRAEALHAEILRRAAAIPGKPCAWRWTATSISQAPTQSSSPASLRPILAAAMLSLSSIRFRLRNFWSCTGRSRRRPLGSRPFRNTCLQAACPILPTCDTPKSRRAST